MIKKTCCLILLTIFCFTNITATAISANSAILYEPITERILFAKNENKKLPMASTTKIITAITAIENCNLEEVAITSHNAAVVEGSSIWLEEGEKMTIENLLYGLMLSSGNDAAIVIAEHISGSVEEFANLMNQTVKKIGVTDTNLTNPSGLDDENHYTTAHDMAKITAYAMKNKIFKKIVSTKSKNITWEGHEYGRKLNNHNKLLSIYEGINGVKTGFTKKDGRCLVSSCEKNSINLIAVTLNAPDDWNDHIKMFDYGYSLLIPKTIEIPMYKIKTIGGMTEYTCTDTKSEVILPMLKNDRIKRELFIPQTVNAPISAGNIAGYENIFLNNKKILKIPIYFKENNNIKFIPNFNFYFKKIIKELLPV